MGWWLQKLWDLVPASPTQGRNPHHPQENLVDLAGGMQLLKTYLIDAVELNVRLYAGVEE